MPHASDGKRTHVFVSARFDYMSILLFRYQNFRARHRWLLECWEVFTGFFCYRTPFYGPVLYFAVNRTDAEKPVNRILPRHWWCNVDGVHRRWSAEVVCPSTCHQQPTNRQREVFQYRFFLLYLLGPPRLPCTTIRHRCKCCCASRFFLLAF